MNPKRRRYLVGAAALGTLGGLAAGLVWPDEGVLNPCEPPDPQRWSAHPMVRQALAGLDPAELWDSHAHLLPLGFAADLDQPWLPEAPAGDGPWPALVMRLQARLIANAACVESATAGPVAAYLTPLLARLSAMPAGCRLVLLAMDEVHDAQGRAWPERSHFSVPDRLCEQAARRWPQRLAWAASIHPYRADAAERVAWARQAGAVAVKWIPAAQAIDPASPRCEPFYRAMVEQRLPLITHGGAERATAGDDALGNPLRLRRALEAGVRVIVAHCASMGGNADLDHGAQGPMRENFDLFSRLMSEPRYERLLFGDLSAIGQRARSGPVLASLLRQGATDGPWAGRLLYGSDYPIPGLMPLFSTAELAARGYLARRWVAPLQELRRGNAWLYDLVLKRLMRWQGQGFADAVFQTRAHLLAR